MQNLINVENRFIWFLVFASALGLEIVALIFQYGLGYEPCVKCVYTRVAVLGIALSAIPALINPKALPLRLISYVCFWVCLVWALIIANDHIYMQRDVNPLFAVCESIPNFPNWMPLHEWLPSVFEVRGMCGDVNWQLFSLSMPEWMRVIYFIYGLAFIGVFSYRLLKTRRL
ncbi:disulfide bond formation protein B [Saccharobesus litoralis]|uniref:Disulfide bond formation protein B n=1 Tax=Saccharobesus litoralis TaxID=2172099 RepID=A0A2S0VTQ6_9ALTE|nr:disulfide bond formation protein B [Saccharobesus litoralis]AWB67573.1 disulfide bond formation protein B [Saccharobesus litoralis]